MSKLLLIFIFCCLVLLSRSESRDFLASAPPEMTRGVRLCFFENRLYLVVLHYLYRFNGKSWILIDHSKPKLPINEFVCGGNKVYGSTYSNIVLEHLLTGTGEWIQAGDIATPGLDDKARIHSITSEPNGLFVTGKDDVKSGVFHLSFTDGKWVSVGHFFENTDLIDTSAGANGEAYLGTTQGNEGSEVYKYDLKEGTWNLLGGILPIQLTEVHYSCNENAVFAGGWDLANRYETVSIHKFDAANSKWIQIGGTIPSNKYGQLGEIRVIDGNIYTWIKSEGSGGGVYRFDDKRNQWVELTPYPWRMILGLFRIERTLYAISRLEKGYGVFKYDGVKWDRIGNQISSLGPNLIDWEWYELNPPDSRIDSL